jgi:hypothetical protein
MVDGELWRTAAGRNAMMLVDLALGWRAVHGDGLDA